MAYAKTDEFVQICIENDYNIKAICNELRKLYPAQDVRPYKVEQRIANCKRRGLLPLASGNFVDRGQVLRGTSTLYDSSGNIKQQWIKSDVDKADMLATFEAAVANIASTIVPIEATMPPSIVVSDLMTVYPIGDAHIGLLAHAPETGADSDLTIIEHNLVSAMTMLVAQANPTETAYIADLGDWYHSDNNENRTAASGNALDVDGRYHKVLEVGLRIAIKLVDLALTKHNTVYWRSSIGNHNTHSAIMMNLFIQAYYRNEPRVIVRNSPSMIDYFQFGKVLLGVTHGHTAKPDKLAQLMPVDCSDIWSSTKFRYFLTGHVHHQSVKEYPTCIIETFRTIAHKDAWHAASGYRSGQDLQCITYHKEYGEVARNLVNLSQIPPLIKPTLN